MDRALQTLLHVFETGQVKLPGRAAFLGARWHPFLDTRRDIIMQQHFKPYEAELSARGFAVSPDMPEDPFDAVLFLAPKNVTEARYLAAKGLSLLRDGGLLACAGGNDEGGTRLEKMLREFGVDDTHALSKNKARAAWGVKTGGLNEAVKEALAAGAEQFVPETGFTSQPGLFAWNKTDRGSALLARHLVALEGSGADFGCGYGYLPQHVLRNNPGVSFLACVDADDRAVRLCSKNFGNKKMPAQFLWEDLTKPVAGLQDLDFIVMNPPFHEGKKTNADIGRDFIRTAHESLRPGGALWMVANAKLDYEKTLAALFAAHEKLYEGEGFKIFRAVK